MTAAALAIVIAIASVRLRILHSRLRRLEAQALTDPLTGAFNRRHLDACLRTAIERRNRVGETASLLLFDVDRFKEINDARGHAAGDAVLKALVALVVGRARKLDSLCRIGGEEFALLLEGTSFARALTVAEDLRALVAEAALLDGTGVSISIGVSELRPWQSAQAWIDDADAALYLAKRSGRNRVAGTHLRRLDDEHPASRTVRMSVPI